MTNPFGQQWHQSNAIAKYWLNNRQLTTILYILPELLSRILELCTLWL